MRWGWALVVLAGCVSTPSEDAGLKRMRAQCAEQARASCEWEQRCHLRSPQMACPPQNFECDSSRWTLVEAGALRFDEVAAAACLREFAEQGCGGGPAVCNRIFVGTAGEGQSCGRERSYGRNPTSPREGSCAEGLVCSMDSTECGTCVVDPFPPDRHPSEGEPCSYPPGLSCAGGLGCGGQCAANSRRQRVCAGIPDQPGAVRCADPEHL